jgi:hypothetical protein
MEFRTKLVLGNKSTKAIVAYIGLGIAGLSMVMIFFQSLQNYIPWVFGSGVFIILVGAVLAKGKIATHGLSEEELVVSGAGIAIGPQFYPLEALTKLDFNVETYAGMPTEAWGMPKDAISDGMGNDLSFRYKEATVACRYYLNSRQHTLQLGDVFREFYERHIPFIERRGAVRTYLFRQLSAEELAEFRKRYGYV